MHRSHRRVAAIALALLSVLSACGGDDDDTAAPTSEPDAVVDEAEGDTSHCTEDGLQFAAPKPPGGFPLRAPCVAAFTGDNGGATTDGVTAEAIEVILFEPTPNEQVAAIAGGPAGDQRDAAIETYAAAFSEQFELYGRELHVERFQGDCPVTPQDLDACLASAQEVVDRNPFAVIWPSSGYPEVFDVWANAGIVAIGGAWYENDYYSGRRPYRYDLTMDGTQTADFVSEYYCKNMAGRPADHAGVVIHETIGGRESPRKLGLIGTESAGLIENLERIRDGVDSCTDGEETPIIGTATVDIETAVAQFQAIVARFIAEGVTTVVVFGEAVSNSLITSFFTASGYFPEHLIPGSGFMDHNDAGRLADPSQWAHAFGPSQLGVAPAAEDDDATATWRAQGNEGFPCGEGDSCQLLYAYLFFTALGVQQAGPALDAAAFEAGLFELPDLRQGDPLLAQAILGESDHTFVSDVKTVYWDPAAVGDDGQPGTYVPVDDGQRYVLGELPDDVLDRVPVAQS